MTTELVELADRLEAESGRLTNWSSNPNDPNLQPMHDHQTKALLTEAANELRALASRAGVDGDTVRMDWLADRDNAIGNVQLPAVCVMNNLHDMRAAIDEAMRLDPEIAAVIAAAPEPLAEGSNNLSNDEEESP